jgi:2-amino-4-hydroxy-6-hydroxymethyldihydropteridine diphosphokinase / dihydropteroate synthase
VRTDQSPMELLDTLQGIEKSMGRQKIIDKGPRNIDLDILLYDQITLENERLNIPHKLMMERDFVLRPLCDIIPNETQPQTYKSQEKSPFKDHLSPLSTLPGLTTITPISAALQPFKALDPTRRTLLMAILNLTPDSFSDGGLHSSASMLTTLSPILSKIDILDIGGQSTRPNAPQISPSEELSRILPTIELLKKDSRTKDLTISIDTYNSSTAEACLAAGADIINDISGGLYDPNILGVVAKAGKSVCLMHTRGTPANMSKPPYTDYPDGLLPTIAAELLERVEAAQAAGIPRWRIILDPGIGFAKTQAGNLEILRDFALLREGKVGDASERLRGIPWLLGSSRKGFVGKITGVSEARNRGWGTATTVAAAVAGGADVVRVHDVKEMADVVSMGDAIWRVGA